MIPIKPHYQRFPVEVVLQHAPNKSFTLEVPARTIKDAVDSTVDGGAREYGYYDWVKITCGDETVERPPHRGGSRADVFEAISLLKSAVATED